MIFDGSIGKADLKTAEYLTAYFQLVDAEKHGDLVSTKYKAWQSKICQECGEVPTPGGYPHIVDEDGYILICCEGYFQINPNAIGLENEIWCDWHENVGGLEGSLPPKVEEMIEELQVKCENCGMNKAQCNFNKATHNGVACCQACPH
jgi:hypothetical protein